MGKERGKYIPISVPRRWVGDLLHFARKVPVVAGERDLKVRALRELRQTMRPPVPWIAIMLKAVGMVSMRVPELRRSYMPYPWPHFHEAPYSVAAVIIDRMYEGEHAAFCVPILFPERRTIPELAAKVEALRTDPIEAHGSLRRIVRVAKYPRPLRRMLWGMGLHWSGMLRANTFGTFVLNSVGAMRGKMLQTMMPISNHFYYGAPDRTGTMLFQSAFDHRVYDAVTQLRALSELESVLNNEMIEELKALKESGYGKTASSSPAEA